MVKKITTTEVLKEKLANTRANSDAAMSEPRAIATEAISQIRE